RTSAGISQRSKSSGTFSPSQEICGQARKTGSQAGCGQSSANAPGCVGGASKEDGVGWIQDQFKKRTEISGKALTETVFPDSSAQRSPEREAWSRLLRGLSQDVEEFQRLGGHCNLQPLSDVQCRISNPPASIAVVVTADLSARTVEYSYESDQKKTAVPEKGIYIRPTNGSRPSRPGNSFWSRCSFRRCRPIWQP